MQVFIVGSPFETAEVLDDRRLNKQIIECGQILDALNGAKAWSNHPCVLQYRGHQEWLMSYKECLVACRNGKSYESPDGGFYDMRDASRFCEAVRPPFHTKEYFDQMKRRLYTKDPAHYAQWAHLGESEENWYFVDGEWRKYKNGKRIK